MRLFKKKTNGKNEINTHESLFQKIVLDKAEKAIKLIEKGMEGMEYDPGWTSNEKLRNEGYKIIDAVIKDEFSALSIPEQIRVLERYLSLALKLIEKGMEYDPGWTSNEKLRNEGFDLTNKIRSFAKKLVKEGIKRETDPTEFVSFGLRLKYPEKQYLRLMESFRILWRIDKMCDRNVRTEVIVEQIDLLKRYAEDNGVFTKHVDEFGRFMKQEQEQYLDDKYKPKTKRFCENLIDVWLAEYLKGGLNGRH